MSNPFSWVSDIYKQDDATKMYSKYRREWPHDRNDPGSLLYGKDRRDKKRATHFGYTPLETGSYIFVVNVEGSGKQVLGAGWYGPKATVLFKNLTTHAGHTAELKYTLDASNNRLWLRSINSLVETTHIEIHVKLQNLQPIFFFPCFPSTPIWEMFNTGVFTSYMNIRRTLPDQVLFCVVCVCVRF
jgi:hypothetical protein